MRTPVKVLSLHQPWATLVAVHEKQIETRSWKTSYRGWVAIHATKTKIDEAAVLNNERMVRTLRDRGYLLQANDRLFWNPNNPLPQGQIVAVARIIEARMMGTHYRQDRRYNVFEEAFGYWSPERYMWTLRDVQPVRPGIPYKGSQGMPWLDEKQLHPDDLARVERLVY